MFSRDKDNDKDNSRRGYEDEEEGLGFFTIKFRGGNLGLKIEEKRGDHFVRGIEQHSQAEEKGIQIKDAITHVEKVCTRNMSALDLEEELEDHDRDKSFICTFYRGLKPDKKLGGLTKVFGAPPPVTEDGRRYAVHKKKKKKEKERRRRGSSSSEKSDEEEDRGSKGRDRRKKREDSDSEDDRKGSRRGGRPQTSDSDSDDNKNEKERESKGGNWMQERAQAKRQGRGKDTEKKEEDNPFADAPSKSKKNMSLEDDFFEENPFGDGGSLAKQRGADPNWKEEKAMLGLSDDAYGPWLELRQKYIAEGKSDMKREMLTLM